LRDLHIDEESIAARLYTAGLAGPGLVDPNFRRKARAIFLLWQIAYAELYVTDNTLADFRRADLLDAIVTTRSAMPIRRPEHGLPRVPPSKSGLNRSATIAQ